MKRLMLIVACLLLTVGNAMAQNRRVTGVVTDAADGSPIQGARAFVNGTSIGTVTDARGVFQLSIPSKYKTLTVTFFGMNTVEAPISASMNIKMSANEKLLDEAIVVAYGTEKKSAFTGSAAEVKSEDITQHVTANAVNAIVGKVAGVQTTSAGGGPGAGPGAVRIRGFGSMSASNAPLYIVDGAPTEVGIATINPQDIESISVLKDAAASAIYGARGANGVIIVTTKRAKKGEDAKVTFDAKWGSNSRLIPQYDVIDDPALYYETHYKAMYNSRFYNGYTSAEAYAFADANLFDNNNGGLGYQVYTVPDGEKLIGNNFKLNPNAKLGYSDGTYYYKPDDWYKEAFHSSFRQEYNVSVSGNEGKLNYYTSVGYLKDGGVVDHSNYSRYTGRTNVDYQAKSWLKFSTNLAFTHTDSETPYYTTDTYGSSGNMFYVANSMGPIYPLYVRNADGTIKRENGRVIYDRNQTNFTRPGVVGNAIGDNTVDRTKSYSDIFTGQWSAIVTPVEGLTLTASLNAQAYNNRYNELSSAFGSNANDGAAYVSHSRTFAVNQQYLANYTKTFNDVHNVTLLAGYEQYKVKDQGLTGSNDHLFDPNIGELNNAKGTTNRRPTSSTDNLMREGFLGRVQYDYDGKYFASASIRRDASSKFAPGHRWGTFGSVGAAWQLNKEAFLEDVDWIDLLKFKASWGAQGNDGGMGYHAYADYYTTTYNETTGEYSISMSAKGNEKLTWEKNKEFNTGIEFELFKGRLNGSVEFYTRKTTDLLYSRTLPASSGYTVNTYPANVGSMRNYGLEVALDGTVIKTKDIQWDLDLNFATNHNEILKLDPAVRAAGLRYSNQIIREGGSLYQAYMLRYAGTNKETGKAQYWKAYTWADDVDVAARDINNPEHLKALSNTYGEGPIVKQELTEDITAASKYDVGSTLPDLVGGFGTTVRGFGFDLSAQFAFSLGGKIYDGQYQQLMHNGQEAGSAMHKDLLKAWSPENKNSNIPRLSTAAADDPGVGSQTPMDRFLISSNYLSLNNITLGYTLPKSLIQPLALQNVRVYVAAENLFVTSKRKGLDPRYNFGIGSMTSGQGRASGDYGAMRSITAGLTLTF